MPSIGSLFASLTLESSQFVQGTKQAAQEAKNMSSQVNDAFGSTKGAMDGATGGVGQFSSALKASRLEMNQSRIGMMEFGHIARGMSDQFASGGLSTQLFTSHIGELSEAISLSSSSFGKLGEFLGGPWGMAVTMGVTVVGSLVGAMLKGGDASDKYRESLEKHTKSVSDLVAKMQEAAVEAENQKEANAIWANSLDGVIAKTETLTAAIQKQLEMQDAVDLQNRATAQKQLASQQEQLNQANVELQQAKDALKIAEEAVAKSSRPDPSHVDDLGYRGNTDALRQLDAARQRLADAQHQVDQLTKAIRDSTNQFISTNEQVAQTQENLTSKAVAFGQIITSNNTAYLNGHVAAAKYATSLYAAGDALAEAAKHAASAGVSFDATQHKYDALRAQFNKNGDVKAYTSAIKELATSLDAAAKAAENAKKHVGNAFSGNQISFGEAEQIARGAGYQVNSAQRPTYMRDEVPGGPESQERLYNRWVAEGKPSDNPVARPGTSAHEGANGKWALDIEIKGDPRVEASNLKKLYGDRGVEVNVFPERGHLHVSGSRSQAAATENAAARAAETLANATDSFDNRSGSLGDQLDKEIAAAKVKLLGSIHDQAVAAGAEADAQKKQLDDQIDALATEAKKKGVNAKTVDAETAILKAKAQQLDDDKHAAINLKEYLDTLQQQNALMKQQLDAQLGHLQFLDSQATSQAERRKIELEILDIERRDKEAALQNLLKQQQAKGDVDGAALTQRQIDNLPQEFADKQQGVLDKTMGPLDAWLKAIPHDADAVNEALQNIAVQGLDGISSAIAGVIDGTESLGKAFSNIAKQIINDIIQMTIKMLLFKVISSFMGGGNAAALANGTFGGPWTGPMPDISAPVPVALALGGPADAGAPYWVGEKGPEMFVPNTSGKIVSNSMSGGQGQNVTINVDARGSTNPAETKKMVAEGILQAMPFINQNSYSYTMRKLRRPAGLNG